MMGLGGEIKNTISNVQMTNSEDNTRSGCCNYAHF